MKANPEPGTLPPKAARMLAKVHKRALADGETEARASEIAWGVVKKSYYKRGGRWLRRKRRLKVGETAPRESNPGRAVKRAPLSVRRLGPVSEHGHVVELLIEESDAMRRYQFKPPLPLLLWSEPRKALLWFEGAKVPKRERTDNPPATAAKAWERFHGWEADTVRTIKAGEPSSWRRVGRAVEITYRNPERWGPDDAEHKIRSPVNVYRGGSVWVLRGGGLRMTARGIEG